MRIEELRKQKKKEYRIKNLKYGLGMLGVILTLSSFINHNRESSNEVFINEEIESDVGVDELKQSNESLKEVEELKKTNKLLEEELNLVKNELEILKEEKENRVLTETEINEIEKRIKKETGYSSYFKVRYSNKLALADNYYPYYNNVVLSDDTYSDINTLLKQPGIEILDLERVNFDLTKLDILNLEEVNAYDISFETVKGIMKITSDNNIDLNYHIEREENLKVLNYMIENNITCHGNLVIGVNNEQELIDICNLLEKIKVKSVVLAMPHIEKENIDVNIKLNDYTSYIRLSGNYLSSEDLEGDKKLLSIEVSSNNPELEINLDDVILNENTRFILPNESKVWIYGSHTDTISLYDLRNTNKVYYYDSISHNGFHSDQAETYHDFVNGIDDAHNKKLVK